MYNFTPPFQWLSFEVPIALLLGKILVMSAILLVAIIDTSTYFTKTLKNSYFNAMHVETGNSQRTLEFCSFL